MGHNYGGDEKRVTGREVRWLGVVNQLLKTKEGREALRLSIDE